MSLLQAIATLGLDASKEELDALFDRLDLDGSGTIEYSELKKALEPSSHYRATRKLRQPPSGVGLPPSELKRLAAHP